jgi:hypothetical protein
MRFSICAAVGGLLIAACTPAATVPTIDGTYKADVTSAKLSTKPDVFTLKDGEYDCSSCTPAYKIPADGQPHLVAGRDYWDAASVKIVDANTLEMTRYRKGAVAGTSKAELSIDGEMLTYTMTSSDNAEGKAVTNVLMSKRSGPAPDGAHATSGSWVAVNDGAQLADEASTATISLNGDTVTQSFPTGERYEAKLGGPQVPLVGDKAGATIAVVAKGKGFKETAYVGGKSVSEYVYTPVDDTTVTMTAKNLKAGTTEEYTLKKQ